MEIENTTESVKGGGALLFLAEAMGPGGSDAAIRGMEKRGQRQLVNSERLPSKIQGDRAEFEALGFTFGEPDPADPLFMPATLPEGWKREASDHDMWSYVLDGHGRKRVAVFYKAAFYDRSAFMRLEALWSYVHAHVEYGEPLLITDEWATREAVLEAMRQHVSENREEAARMQACSVEEWRTADNRTGCAEYAGQYQAKAAKYVAAIAALEADAATAAEKESDSA